MTANQLIKRLLEIPEHSRDLPICFTEPYDDPACREIAGANYVLRDEENPLEDEPEQYIELYS